ncbi:MAG TPA: polysaccharide biosynthesis C-terminal domain-containing protein [Nitrososphaerales archaeon]|nr:polysaccharide biosynthesis C-terminal domain-containing protein [Nitrososphaerales archaeon]
MRFLHVQNFGVLAFLDAIFSLLGGLFMPLTHQAQARYVPELMAQERYPQVRRLIRVGQRINIILALAIALPFVVFAAPLAQALGNPSWTLYIQLMALSMVISAGLGILKAILNAFYDQKFLSIWESFFSFASLVLIIALVVYLQWGVTGAILVGIITYGASWVLYLYRVNTKYSPNVRGESEPLGKPLERRIRKYVIPNAAINLVASFGSIYGGVLFLGIYTTPAQVAYFDIPNTFVQRVFSQVQLVIGGLSLVTLVEVNVRNSSNLALAARQFTKFVSVYALPVMAGGLVLASPILTVLYGSQALPSVLPFQILTLVIGVATILQFSGVLLFVLDKAFRAFLWYVLDAAILMVLNILLIPPMGVLGAVIALSVSALAMGVGLTYDASVRLGVGVLIPFDAIARATLASVVMGLFVFGVGLVLPITNAASLTLAIVLGTGVYLCCLRFMRVFSETDRRLVEASRIPFKSFLLKFFWRARES